MDHAEEAATTTAKQYEAEETTLAKNTAETESRPNANAEACDTSQPAPRNPRLVALQNKHATLTTKLSDLQAERARLVSQTTLPSGLAMPEGWSDDEKAKHALSSANTVIKDHIRLLHEYNEIKDIGQGLMGLVAEGRGVRIKAVMEDFGVGEKD